MDNSVAAEFCGTVFRLMLVPIVGIAIVWLVAWLSGFVTALILDIQMWTARRRLARELRNFSRSLGTILPTEHDPLNKRIR